MKRLLTIIALAGAVFGATAATSTADAHASSYKRCSGHTSGWTRGGHFVSLGHYGAHGRMNCASVRYAAKHLRKRMTQTWRGWPNVSYFDGYVRWYCRGLDGGGIHCREYTSNTSFDAWQGW